MGAGIFLSGYARGRLTNFVRTCIENPYLHYPFSGGPVSLVIWLSLSNFSMDFQSIRCMALTVFNFATNDSYGWR